MLSKMSNKFIVILVAFIISNAPAFAQTKTKRIVEGKAFQQSPRLPMPMTIALNPDRYRTFQVW